MSFKLIHIRFIQLIRVLKEGGFGSVLLPILIAVLSFASFKAYQNQMNGLLLIAVIMVFCVSLQMARNDNLFAQLQIPNWHIQMFAENVLLTLPFSITALFTSNYYYFAILLLLLCFVPYIRYSAVKKASFKSISKLFDAAHSIEWI